MGSLEETPCYTRPALTLPLALSPVWTSTIVALGLAAGTAADAVSPPDYQKPVPPVAERLEGAANRYANLSPSECRTRLAASEYAASFKKHGKTNGIASPYRIVAPLGSVEFRVPPARVSYGTIECRQALVWIDLIPVLERHGVREVRIDNFYRNRARLGRRGKKSQHAYGLASDVMSFRFDLPPSTDGEPTQVTVLDDYAGKRGEPSCGPDARLHLPKGASPEAHSRSLALRNLVCEIGRGGYFHHVLTPNYDAAHENHLHLDIKRDCRWFSLD